MLRKHTLLLGLVVFLALGVFVRTSRADTSPAAAPAAPTTEERVFDVTRDGNKIGVETVTIQKDGDTTTINFKTHIEVVIMFIVVHRFDHRSTEIWKDGKFVSYKSFTKENGKVHDVIAKVKGDKIALTVNGEEKDVGGDLVFASFWNKDFLGQKTLLDSDTGRELSVDVADLGPDKITLKDGSTVKAHHYKLSGDLERDLWFDGDNLIRIKLFGSDHSTIMSELTPDKSN